MVTEKDHWPVQNRQDLQIGFLTEGIQKDQIKPGENEKSEYMTNVMYMIVFLSEYWRNKKRCRKQHKTRI